MITKDVVDKVIVEQRAAVVREHKKFEYSGVGVEDCYHDVVVTHLEDTDQMLKPITDDEAKLIEAKLPKELNRDTRQACQRWFRYWDDDPKRRVTYEADPDEERSPEIDEAEIKISEQRQAVIDWNLWEDLRLRRLPHDAAVTYRMHIVEGYTWPEIAEKRGVSEWTARQDFAAARAGLRYVLEHAGHLAPREPVENPEEKARREAIERHCAQLRPAVTKPTLYNGRQRTVTALQPCKTTNHTMVKLRKCAERSWTALTEAPWELPAAA